MALIFDANRARAADLLALPPNIQGTNCSNCMFIRGSPNGGVQGVGYCEHPRMRMNVLHKWCCSFWKRPDAPLASPPRSRRFAARKLLARFRKLK